MIVHLKQPKMHNNSCKTQRTTPRVDLEAVPQKTRRYIDVRHHPQDSDQSKTQVVVG